MNQVDDTPSNHDLDELARALGESQATARADLARILGHVGIERARELVQRAREIHATGEPAHLATTADNARPRTLGGVFFQLAREHLPITPPPQRRRRLPWSDAAELAAQAQAPDDAPDQASEESNPSGAPNTVKITLIGRPGKVIKRDTVVVTTMHNLQRPSLPKQLPKLSGADVETRYTIFIASRQWNKVENAIYTDKEDRLVIEGYPFLDPDVQGICVFARATTTVSMQRAAREAQRAR